MTMTMTSERGSSARRGWATRRSGDVGGDQRLGAFEVAYGVRCVTVGPRGLSKRPGLVTREGRVANGWSAQSLPSGAFRVASGHLVCGYVHSCARSHSTVGTFSAT